MTLHEYLQGMKGKTAAVIGLGVSNRPLVELLARNGVKVIACDRKERAALGSAAAHYEALGAVLHLGEGYLRDLDADVVFRTPGMRPDVPELLEAKAHGAVITSEMEAFFAVCPCPIIGVTGSDGKTTTASVIAELLKAEGRRVWLGGNIGRPLLADAEQMTPDDLAVLELSSFQLMDMPYSPQVAVLTNLAPNHLDVHRDMAEYIASKENIYLHQSARDTAIFNADNAITRDLSGKAVGRARLFSRQEEVADGAFVRGGAIWLRDAAGEREVLPLADIRLPGWHNVENYMAALLAVDGLVRDETVRRVAREFAGVEHRIEFVRELHGVRYYNDSIATSPTRTIAGLRAFPHKVVLIAGGYDKHIPFAPLAPEVVEHVKTLLLCGATAEAIERAVVESDAYETAAERPRILRCKDLREAVDAAYFCAESGDVVTLSPACAAFDCYANFMERGRAYKEMVKKLGE